MARTGALEASSEGSIPSSPTRRSDGTVDVLRSERSVLMGVWVRIPPSALLPLPVEPDVGLRSRQVEFDSRLGLTACQSRRSARLPVTEEITGSSPVQAASCRCQWTWCRPCEGWMRRFDSWLPDSSRSWWNWYTHCPQKAAPIGIEGSTPSERTLALAGGTGRWPSKPTGRARFSIRAYRLSEQTECSPSCHGGDHGFESRTGRLEVGG